MKDTKTTINVKGTAITIIQQGKNDFISLTDMVKSFDGGSALIEKWLQNKDTILFLGVWEELYNPVFNSPEFRGISAEAGRNTFHLSAKRWIESTGAIGIRATAGRYGGTYAHKDIAFEFGSWLSPEFKLYLIKEFQRLKEEESERLSLEWNLNRTLSRLNYRIHTDAIKAHIIPEKITKTQEGIIYATEADVLNIALFGQTAKEWREAHPGKDGNIRDVATTAQLLVLANLESMNAELIKLGMTQSERLKRLNTMAIDQLQTLLASDMKRLPASGK